MARSKTHEEGDKAAKKKHKKERKEKKSKKEKKPKDETKKRRRHDNDVQPVVKNSKKKTSHNHSNIKLLHFDHDYIVAPMVGASELPFRLLTRKYGAQLAYTPMMSSTRFVDDPDYREEIFQTNALDRPLACHFSANKPDEFAQAVQLVNDQCDAVDLNLGCPQRTAFVGHFGSYLLDPPDRQLICDIVKAGVKAVSPPKPILVKIRLLKTLEETVELCQQLKDAGASLIAIHARHRAGWERKGPGARDGPALLDFITQIKEQVPNIPIIANGNVIIYEDVLKNQTLTGADGIMSAEGILDNPSLFLPRLGGDEEDNTETVTIVDPTVHCRPEDIPTGSDGQNGHASTIEPAGTMSAERDNNIDNNKDCKDPLQKRKRKLLKKQREIHRIQAKIKKQDGDLSWLEKTQKQKLEAQVSVEQELDSIQKQLQQQEESNNSSEKKNGKKECDNHPPPRSKDKNDIKQDTTTITVANSTRTIPLSELYNTANDKIALAQEYLQLAQRFGPTIMRTQIFHVRRMMKDVLDQYQLMPDCLACNTPAELWNVVKQCQSYRDDPNLFVYDRQKAKEQALALERKRHEEGKRKAFEARMIRKAKREGKLHDLEYYLRQGATVPTQKMVKRLKAMTEKQQQLEAWKNDHSQHCLAYHLSECQRGRACAFLHVDATSSDGKGATVRNTSFEEQDEVAG